MDMWRGAMHIQSNRVKLIILNGKIAAVFYVS